MSGSRLATLPPAARWLYTAFAALTVAGVVSCALLYDDIVHLDAHATPQDLDRRLVAHYRLDSDGAVTRRQLLETTHAHLFEVPLLVLAAGHLFVLGGASARAKLAWILVANGAAALHLAAPWIVYALAGRYASSALYPTSGGVLLLATVAMVGHALAEMWTRRA